MPVRVLPWAASWGEVGQLNAACSDDGSYATDVYSGGSSPESTLLAQPVFQVTKQAGLQWSHRGAGWPAPSPSCAAPQPLASAGPLWPAMASGA